MKKRFCFLIIALLMLNTINATQMFVTPDTADSIMLSYNGNGSYSIPSGLTRFVSFKVTQDASRDAVYTAQDGTTFFRVSDSEFVEVVLNSKPLLSRQTYAELQELGLPSEVLEDIAKKAAYAQSVSATDARIEYYTLSPASANTVGRSTPVNTLPVQPTIWNNFNFDNYEIYFTNLPSPTYPVLEGNDVTEEALALLEFAAGVAVGDTDEALDAFVSLFDFGMSALDFVDAVTSEPFILISSSNFVEANFKADLYCKYTYFNNPWTGATLLGCCSQKVILREVTTRIGLYNSLGGEEIYNTETPNSPFYSPNYNSPEAKAYMYAGSAWVERVAFDVMGTNFEIIPPAYDWPEGWPI